jgi:hypothetical protein
MHLSNHCDCTGYSSYCYLGLLKHSIDCVTSFLEHHSRIHTVNQLCAMMPPYPGFAWSNKSYNQVTPWSGMAMKAFGRAIVQVLATTLFTRRWWIRFPSQMPRFVSRSVFIFTWWHTTGTKLRPWSSTWQTLWVSFILRMMFSADSMADHPQRRSWNPGTSSLLWTKWRNEGVTAFGPIIRRL